MNGSGLLIALPVRGLHLAPPSSSQSLEIKRYNYAEWTKGRFSEAVAANGPGKTNYLAGNGADDELQPFGSARHTGNFPEQCRYSYD